MKRFHFCLFIAMMTLAGCNQPPKESNVAEQKKPATTAPAPIVMESSMARETNPPVSLEDVDVLVKGMNEFATDLYGGLTVEGDANLFFSPYSISQALAMTFAGAQGATKQQMANVLHFMQPDDMIHPCYDGLYMSLENQKKQFKTRDGEVFNLNVANAFWGQKGHEFNQEYLDLLARWYGAGLMQVNFSEPQSARETINNWVSGQTKDKIKNLIPEGVLDDMTRLILTNAIYFKARWDQPFEKTATNQEPFTRLGGDQSPVDMMHMTADLPYAQGDGYKAVALSYEGSSIHMAIILPDEDRFSEIQDRLDPRALGEILDSVTPGSGGIKGPVILSLPRFRLESTLSLAQILSTLGMPDAFSPTAADFSGMDGNKAPEGLFISDVLHKAFIDVNELGTEAAAATAVLMNDGAALPEDVPPPFLFKADRPFIYVIRDGHTGAILFLGRVMNPSA